MRVPEFVKRMINGHDNEYPEDYTLTEKINFTNKMNQKYPDRVPVIIGKATNEKILQNIDNTKYLIPKNLKMRDLLTIIRKKVKKVGSIPTAQGTNSLLLSDQQALFLFAGQNLVPMNLSIGEIYDTYHHPDTFLYIFYTLENTFG